MEPRLVGVSGPLKGETFGLNEDEITVGREFGSRLLIADPMVSRRHCLLRKEGGGFTIFDLESRNGTFVNDVEVSSQPLKHADRIRIGTSLFLYLVHEGDSVTEGSGILVEESEAILGTTIRLRPEDAHYLQPDKALSLMPATAVMARDLAALLKISTTINSIRKLEDLHKQILELIFEVVPAERGAILERIEGGDGFTCNYATDRKLGPDQKVRVSKSLVDSAFREGVSLLRSNARGPGTEAVPESIAAFRIQSVLCVPLRLFGEVHGAVYLDSTDPSAPFFEDHLQLVTAVAGIVALALENLKHVGRLELENQRLSDDLGIEYDMLGESPAMRQVNQIISSAAQSDLPVLIEGEGGTGKELIARAIHQSSPRAGKPFLVVRCAAATESQLETEIFGCENVSASGSVTSEKGKLEGAHGGTLFFDEVASLGAAVQISLVQMMSQRGFTRVGGRQVLRADARIIAATCRNLEEEVQKRTFIPQLRDLLRAVTVSVPPLRDRREDIVLLANYFCARYSQKCTRAVRGVSPEACDLLARYHWPGNVRELQNAIERAVVLGITDWILPEDLPESVHDADPPPGRLPGHFYDEVREAKRSLVEKALQQADGKPERAARHLGIHPRYFRRFMASLNVPRKLKL